MVRQRETGQTQAAQLSKYLGVGLTSALSTVLFAYLGLVGDGQFGTKPLLTLLGAFVGAGAGFYYLYHHLVVVPREQGRQKEGDGQ